MEGYSLYEAIGILVDVGNAAVRLIPPDCQGRCDNASRRIKTYTCGRARYTVSESSGTTAEARALISGSKRLCIRCLREMAADLRPWGWEAT